MDGEPFRQTERKHIAIRRMFNEEMQERKECTYEYINTCKLNPVDYLTKSSQTEDTFKAFRAKYMVNMSKDPAVTVKLPSYPLKGCVVTYAAADVTVLCTG